MGNPGFPMLETVAAYRPGRSRYSTRPMEIEISDPRLTDELRAYRATLAAATAE